MRNSRPVVVEARERVPQVFGGRLHSAYPYGSIPRGTARPGRSDLDLLLVLRGEPAAADRAAARSLDETLSDVERYDLGWLLACLCTPLLGEDLALHLPHWRARVAEADGDDARRALVRGCSRRLVRTGFTLVMPRWNGWTSALHEMAEAFGAYYPERAAQMRAAAVAGYEPGADGGVLRSYLDGLGPWLAEEYARVHGLKAPRPGNP